MVPTITKGKAYTPMVSTMQLEKGLKKNEVTYLVALKEDTVDPMGDPLPVEVKKVLDEFKDVMPLELPKRLPPRRKEDHKIELVLGADREVSGRRIDKDVCNIGGGECHTLTCKRDPT